MEAEIEGKEELRMNFAVLKRIDPDIKEILSRAKQVALYDFDTVKNEWELTKTIGALFFCSRVNEPYFNIIIMNRINPENFIEPIIKQLEWQVTPPFLLYTNLKKIHGIWFYNPEEFDCVTSLITLILESMKSTDEDESSKKEREKNISVQLKKAQEDYVKSTMSHRPLQVTPQPSTSKGMRPKSRVNTKPYRKSASAPSKVIRPAVNRSFETQPSQKLSASTCKKIPCSPKVNVSGNTNTAVVQRHTSSSKRRKYRKHKVLSRRQKNTTQPMLTLTPSSSSGNKNSTEKDHSPNRGSIEYFRIIPTPPPEKFEGRELNSFEKAIMRPQLLAAKKLNSASETLRSENASSMGKTVSSTHSKLIATGNSRPSISRQLNYSPASMCSQRSTHSNPSKLSTSKCNIERPSTSLGLLCTPERYENGNPLIMAQSTPTRKFSQHSFDGIKTCHPTKSHARRKHYKDNKDENKKYTSTQSSEEKKTRTDTPEQSALKRPYSRATHTVTMEEPDNEFTKHLLQALKYLVENDPTVLPKLHEAYGNYLSENSL